MIAVLLFCFLGGIGLREAVSEQLQAKNLALYGKATQSDLIDNPWSGYSDAYNAIDGNRDSHFHHGSCTATEHQTNPWWRVDLLKEYIITSVVITNRRDCCPDRLDGAEVRIGNSLLDDGNQNPLAGRISCIPAGGSHTLTLKENNVGRYVNVLLPGVRRLLTLCEVEVYGHPKADEHLALRGVATQSSLYGHGFALNAIDGNRDGRWEAGSCSHTQKEFSPWWRVDLLLNHQVLTVTITNTILTHERLNGTEIQIGTNLHETEGNRCAVISSIPPGASSTFDCNGIIGRYVTVVIPGREEWLSLCEVEVSGLPVD